MRRFEGKMTGQQYCADLHARVVHDLDRETLGCEIDRLISEDKEQPFFKLVEAYLQSYTPCEYCIRLPRL